MMCPSNIQKSAIFIYQNPKLLNKAFITLDERNVKKKGKLFRRWLMDKQSKLYCRWFIE